MEKNTFTVLDDQGKEVVCNVLFTFDSEETGKSYIAYTDNSVDEEGNTQVFASIFNPDSETTNLEPIQTEKEWKAIEVILETLQEEAEKKEQETQTIKTEGTEQ